MQNPPTQEIPFPMLTLDFHPTGRHFLQIPGPSPVPDRILRAMSLPTIDHRGPEFQEMSREVLAGLKEVFKTREPVVIFPASGTGAWEAALSNTMSPGDHVLMYESGHFATLWQKMATRLGLKTEFLGLPGIEGWRRGVQAHLIEERLKADKEHSIKAVCVVHNETSTGVVSRIGEVRKAIDRAKHPALFLVDTISSLASIDYRHEEWGVDVTVGGSQKGLMLPPGLSFNAISDKALAASRKARLPRSYWDWQEMLAANEKGLFPYTPATNLLQGLKVAIDLLHDEGLDNVFARHDRAAEATRRCVRQWGLEVNCRNPHEHSSSLTAVRLPEGSSADALRAEILARCNMSLGNGLGPLADKVFRIGHVGDFSDLSVTGTLAGIEIGMKALGIPHRAGGLDAATTYLSGMSEAARSEPPLRVAKAV